MAGLMELGRRTVGSTYGENTQPLPGFNPPQWKSGCGKVAMKARNKEFEQ